MKIAILGFGIEGKLAYDYWNKPENQITICDQNQSAELPVGVNSRLGDDYLLNLDEFDLIVRSPSLHPDEITKNNGEQILNKVTTITNEFFKVSPTKNIIGVTGTKGKGTTSTLIRELLINSNHSVHLAGNIGNGAMDILKNDIHPDDWVVLELSSFQLIDLKYSPIIAVCLMVSPEHLNWHKDMDEYIGAKKNLFLNQAQNDLAIYYADNDYSIEIAGVSPGKKIPYFKAPGATVQNGNVIIDGEVICGTNEIKLLGKHNWQNVCAALTAFWQIIQNKEVAHKVITQFKGLEHRLEFVSSVEKVNYYNDSFASAPDATIAALQAINGPKVMIIGGFDRGLDLKKLAKAIKNYESGISKVVLIGASSSRVANELQNAGFDNFIISESKSMPEIIGLVKLIAQPLDSVVLSPGFPSFDIFKNFEDRGLQFKDSVNKL